LSSDTEYWLHHRQHDFLTQITIMTATNMSIMIIALVITTICLSNAKGENEKVSTH
jgi:hypothetical protein